MLVGTFLALMAGLCFAFGAGLFAAATRRQLPFMAFLCLGAVTGLVLSLVFVVDWSAVPTVTRAGPLCLWITLGAIANVAGHRSMASAMLGGHTPVAWAIGQGGQAIPFVASAVIWHERAGAVPWVGVIAILLGVATLAWTRSTAGTTSRRAVRWALVALICYGVNNTLMAVPSHWVGWTDTLRLRLPLTLAVFAVGGAIAAGGIDTGTFRRLAPMSLAYGVILVTCFGLVYLALDHLGRAGAAGLFWPTACGGGIVAYAGYEHLVRRKPITRGELAGIATIVAGIALLAVRRTSA